METPLMQREGRPVPRLQAITRIVEATYGSGTDVVDVTARLQNLVRNGHLLFTVSNNVFTDPCPGKGKTLHFTYELFGDDQRHQHEVGEHQLVDLPPTGA
jgi:hypothetical protein